MLRVMKVTGNSLEPEAHEGDYVLVSMLPVWLGRLKVGDWVVFRHAVYGTLIKALESLDGEQMTVTGTNPVSVDSRIFGAVPRRNLVGKVVRHFRQPGGG